MNTIFIDMDHELFIKQLQNQHYTVDTQWDSLVEGTSPAPVVQVEPYHQEEEVVVISSDEDDRPEVSGINSKSRRLALCGAARKRLRFLLKKGVPREEARKQALIPFYRNQNENGKKEVRSDNTTKGQATTKPKKVVQRQKTVSASGFTPSGYIPDIRDIQFTKLDIQNILFTKLNTAPRPSTELRSVSPTERRSGSRYTNSTGQPSLDRPPQPIKRQRSSPSPERFQRGNYMRGSSEQVTTFTSSYNRNQSDRGRAPQPTKRRRSSPSLDLSQRDSYVRGSSGQVSSSSFSYNQSQSDRGRAPQPMERRRSSPSLELSQRGNYMKGPSGQMSKSSSSYNQSRSDRGRPSQTMNRQRQNASPEVIQEDNYMRGSSLSRSSTQMTMPISSYSRGQSDSGRSSESMKRQRSPELSQGDNYMMMDNPSPLNSLYSQASDKPLKVAIIDKRGPLTSRQVDLVKAELTKLLDRTLSTNAEELPTFRSWNYAQMKLKITCENKGSLDWLRDAVRRLPPLWAGAALDVISLENAPPSNLTKATLWIANTSDESEVILRRLAVQNPWANVESWSLIRRCMTPKGVLLIFGVDEVTENILESHEGRVNYMFNSSQVRIKKKNSANQARSNLDAPRSAEMGGGRRRDH